MPRKNTGKPPGRPAYQPNDDDRGTVNTMASLGVAQELIARCIKVDAKTLRKHYSEELELSATKANAQIGGVLFRKAMEGDTSSLIFWAKTRMGWKDTSKLEVETKDVTLLDILTRANMLQKSEGDT